MGRVIIFVAVSFFLASNLLAGGPSNGKSVIRDNKGDVKVVEYKCKDKDYLELIGEMEAYALVISLNRGNALIKIEQYKKEGKDIGSAPLPNPPNNKFSMRDRVTLPVLDEKVRTRISEQEDYYTGVTPKTIKRRYDHLYRMEDLMIDVLNTVDEQCVATASQRQSARDRGPGVYRFATINSSSQEHLF